MPAPVFTITDRRSQPVREFVELTVDAENLLALFLEHTERNPRITQHPIVAAESKAYGNADGGAVFDLALDPTAPRIPPAPAVAPTPPTRPCYLVSYFSSPKAPPNALWVHASSREAAMRAVSRLWPGVPGFPHFEIIGEPVWAIPSGSPWLESEE